MNKYSIKPPESQEQDRSAQNAQNIQESPAVDQREKTAPAIMEGSPDRVDINGQSGEIDDIMAAVNQLHEVRDNKVQAIKQSVDAGTYSVDSSKVASAIIKSI